MHIILDLVLNHTSSEHPWFKAARQPGNPFHEWYVWSKNKPKSKASEMVFTGYQDDIWSFDSTAREWYYHRFYSFEPDLDTQYPPVRNMMDSVMHFWLATGISGFRIDAVTYLTELADTSGHSFSQQLSLLQNMRELVARQNPRNILLGEANVPAGKSDQFFGKYGERLNMIFNFYVDQRLFYALATEDVDQLQKALEDSREIPLQSDWVYFLRNQDEMGMGRFSKKEREQVYRAFAPTPNMQLYDRGVRRRLAPMLNNNQQRLKMAYSFLFSLQGVPMIRYGDEIGMGDNLNLNERLAVRTPMQWNDSPNAGFSTAIKTLRPVVDQPPFNYARVNVKAQDNDSASLLNWIRRLAKLRKAYPAIAMGDWECLQTKNNHVLATAYHWNGEQIICIHNFNSGPQQLQLSGEWPFLEDILEKKGKILPHGHVFTIKLPAYGYCWLRSSGN